MKSDVRVGLMGATGMVGTEMLRILEERNFPVAELHAYASPRSEGRRLPFRDGEVVCEVLRPGCFDGLDLVIVDVEDDLALEWAPQAAAAGALVVDNSAAFRMDPDVPVVVAEVNPEDLSHLPKNIASCPNCTTAVPVTALAPLHRAARIDRMVVSTYQSVSGAGQAGLHELDAQWRKLSDRTEELRRAGTLDAPVIESEVWSKPIAGNVIPLAGSLKEEGYTSEEWKMVRETRKILHDDEIKCSVTCVRVPVFVGHAVSVNVRFHRAMDKAEAVELLRVAPGVRLVDDGDGFPTPLEAAGIDPVLVGRIREDLSEPGSLNLWITGDNLRKGAALNGVQLAEVLISRSNAPAPCEDALVTTTASAAESPAAPPARPRMPRWRRILSAVLIVLSCVLVPISVVAVWARNQILNTDEYVDTVAPLARNEDIVNALSVRVTNTLFERVDVEQLAAEDLPPRVAFLAAPLTDALRQFTRDATLRFFQSDLFQTLWDEANRRAHAQVENALTGGGDVISTENGKVVLDLSPVVLRLRSELSERGIGIFDDLPIGELTLRFELFDAEGLEQAQVGVRLLDRLRIVLPILVLVFAAIGIWLAGDRRKALMRWGFGVVAATLVLGFALAMGRDIYLDALPASSSRAAAGAAFDIVVRFLRYSNRVLFVIGLLVAIGAYLAGSSRMALAVRGRTTGALGEVGDRAAARGWDFGPVAGFVAHYAVALRVFGVIVAFLVLIAMSHPDGLTVLWLLLALLVYLAVLTVLERIARDRTSVELRP